ncbi:hypothetical protein [Tautonia rosea]|uniref:hypothetical protein n=1 Tax=Tautonia rosea TaxID=2728037 RepID=UPI0014730AE6|nr:hypothetical protein [Tautonia rosea]
MRRLPALATFFVLSLPVLGCGYSSYEARLEATQGRLKDDMILDQQLYSAAQGPFAENSIFLRVPQGLAQRPEFELIPLNPDAFEVEASFNPQSANTNYSLHVLARRDSQEPPDPEQPPRAARGDFRSDVINVLAQVYGPDIASAPIEQVNKTVWPRSDVAPPITFERLTMTDRNLQLIHLYFYKEESGDATYDVALIWEYPSGEAPTATPNPVDLTLGTFAVGQRAASRFSGRPDSVGGATGDGGSAVAF